MFSKIRLAPRRAFFSSSPEVPMHALSPTTIDLDSLASSALERLYAGHSLSQGESENIFLQLVEGRLSEMKLAATLVALKLKGETADELIGAARALRSADVAFERPDYLFADSCGTGGDGAGTINISTAVAFVAAAAGLPIAKHGNRSVTSRCGSADVLEHLGVKLDVSPITSRRAMDQTGICFLLAPLYHPGLKYAAAARRTLNVRTIMNALGPCVNPAEPTVQLLGVSEPRLLQPVAETLAALGTKAALVVHGAGLDEIAMHGRTDAIRVTNGEIEYLTISPQDAGFEQGPLNAVKGGDARENAERLKTLLSGGGSDTEKKMVAINCGALLMTAGRAVDLKEGAGISLDVLASGAAYRTLLAFAEATHA